MAMPKTIAARNTRFEARKALSSQDGAGSDSPADPGTARIETTAGDEWHATVALYGEIDAAAAPALHFELKRHLDAGRNVLRIDAGGVGFIDSTAIGALVTAAERCTGVHGSLILTNVPARVRQVIRLSGLDTVLLIDTARDGQAQDPS